MRLKPGGDNDNHPGWLIFWDLYYQINIGTYTTKFIEDYDNPLILANFNWGLW